MTRVYYAPCSFSLAIVPLSKMIIILSLQVMDFAHVVVFILIPYV